MGKSLSKADFLSGRVGRWKNRQNQLTPVTFSEANLLRYINDLTAPNFEVKVNSIEDYSANPDKYHNGMNIYSLFSELLETKKNVDVVLSCETDLILSHKIILFMNSTFLKRILQKTNYPNPIITLEGIRAKTLKHVLTYIYLGEVLIDLHDVRNFTIGIESLGIIGSISYAYGVNLSSVVIKNTAYITKSLFPGIGASLIGLNRWGVDKDKLGSGSPPEHWPDAMWIATLKTTPIIWGATCNTKISLLWKRKKGGKYPCVRAQKQKTLKDFNYQLRNYLDAFTNPAWFPKKLYVINEESEEVKE